MSLSISQITKKFPSFFVNKQFEDGTILNANAPIASLRQGFTKIRTYFNTEAPRYESIAFAGLNADELYDLAVEQAELGERAPDVGSGTVYPEAGDDTVPGEVRFLGSSNAIVISEDTAMAIANSIHESSTPIDGSSDEYCVITDSAGRAFKFIVRISNDAISRVDIEVNNLWLQFIAEHPGSHSWMIRKEIVPMNFAVAATSARGKVTSYFNVVKDIARSITLNDVLRDTCDAVLSSRPGQAVAALASGAEARSKSTADLYRRFAYKIKSVWEKSGIRGLFSYISSYFRTNSMTDENGCLQYTDNKLLKPKEFLTGIITAFVTAFIEVVGLILTVLGGVFTVLGAIVGLVGGLIGSLFNSIPSAAKASIATTVDEDDQLSILNYSPVALFQISFNHSASYSYLEAAYTLEHSPLLFPVVGGAILVGPGLVDQTTGAVTQWKAEFHPYSVPIYAGHAGLDLPNLSPSLSGLFVHSTFTGTSDIYYGLDVKALKTGTNMAGVSVFGVKSLWNVLTTPNAVTGDKPYLDFSSATPNLDSGAVTDIDDKRLSVGVNACAAMFLLSVIVNFDLSDYGNYVIGPVSNIYINTGPGEGYYEGVHFESYDTGANGILSSFIAALLYDPQYTFRNQEVSYQDFIQYYQWTYLVSCADVISTSTPSSNIRYTVYDSSIDHFIPVQNLFLVSNPVYCQNLLTDAIQETDNIRGPYEVIPSNYQWAHKLPTYNSATMLSTIFLATAITAVAVAATVAVSVAYSKFAKSKRAKNLAKFNEAQATYQAACNGEELVYNSETHSYDTYQFDVSSTEGQAKIKDAWKNYKRTALKNNLWANFVGGSKFDCGTFWGEKDQEEASESSLSDSVSSFSNDFIGSDPTDPTSESYTGDSLITLLISGKPFYS